MDENTQNTMGDNPVPALEETPPADAVAPAPDMGATAPDEPAVGLIDRPRQPRPPFVPAWVPIAAIVAAAAFVLVGGGLISANFAGRVVVPNVTGIEVGLASARLAQDKLGLAVSQRRFSDKPADTVLSQSPPPGTKLKRGDAVTVVVSGGTEQFALPDVTGDGLLLARGILESKGLSLHVEIEPSSQPSDTVLSMNPSPGTLVSTGDIITVSIAATGPASGLLLPYDMHGVTVDLDPAPVAGGEEDITLDVARRLQSLIEASGGRVLPLRALADTGTAGDSAARAARATSGGHATVSVGFSVIQSGPGGMLAISPSTGLTQVIIPSKILASNIASELAAAGQSVKTATTATDPVLGATQSPWTRVQLGSFSAKEDVARFQDPNWADTVARSIYRSVASLYGKKSPTG